MGLSSAPALIWWCDPSVFWDTSTFLPWGALAKRNMHCQAGRNHWEAIFIHLVVDPWGNDSWFLWSNQHEKLHPGDICVPLAHFQVLMASWHNHESWSFHPSSPTSASLFSLGRHWGIWPYQRKESVKVCFWGILSILQFSGDKFYSRDFFHTIQKYLEPSAIGKALENIYFGRKF